MPHGDIPEGGVCSPLPMIVGRGCRTRCTSGFVGRGGANHARGSSRGVKSGQIPDC